MANVWGRDSGLTGRAGRECREARSGLCVCVSHDQSGFYTDGFPAEWRELICFPVLSADRGEDGWHGEEGEGRPSRCGGGEYREGIPFKMCFEG